MRFVEVAARAGGSDPKANTTLATAIDKARAASVPNDNIERAIKRGTGDLEGGARYEEVVYEGDAPGGVAMFVETLTDNRNRTAQEVRHAFTRNGGNLGEAGSVAWMFHRKGVIQIEKSAGPDEERLLEIVLEAGAEDLRDSESTWEVTTDPTTFAPVRDALENRRCLDRCRPSLLDGAADDRAGRARTGQAGPLAARGARGPTTSSRFLANFDIPEAVMAGTG